MGSEDSYLTIFQSLNSPGLSYSSLRWVQVPCVCRGVRISNAPLSLVRLVSWPRLFSVRKNRTSPKAQQRPRLGEYSSPTRRSRLHTEKEQGDTRFLSSQECDAILVSILLHLEVAKTQATWYMWEGFSLIKSFEAGRTTFNPDSPLIWVTPSAVCRQDKDVEENSPLFTCLLSLLLAHPSLCWR